MKNYAFILLSTLIFAFTATAQSPQTSFIDLEKDFECGSIYTYQKYPTENSHIVLHLKVSEHDALFLEAKPVDRNMYFFSTEEKDCSEFSSGLFNLKLSFNPDKEKFYFKLGEKEDETTYQIVKKSTMFYSGDFFQYISNDIAFQLKYKEGKFEDLGKANSEATVQFDSFDKKHSYHNINVTVRSKSGKHPARTMVMNPVLGIISIEDQYTSTINSGMVMELTSIDLFNYHDFLELQCKFHPETCNVTLPSNVNSRPSTVSSVPLAYNQKPSNSANSALDPTAPTLAVQPLRPEDYLANGDRNIPSEYGQYGYIVVYDIDRQVYVNKLTGEKANGFYGGVLYVNGRSMDKGNNPNIFLDENVLLASLDSKGNNTNATPVKLDNVVPKNDSDCLEVSTLRTHVVQRGETIITIAKLYDIDVRSLKSWNGMSNSIDLYPCMRLYLNPPRSTETPKGNTEKIDCMESPTYNTHIVQSDENIVSIANLYGISTQQLKNWNGLRNSYVAPCTRLLIQRPTDYSIVMHTPTAPMASPAPPEYSPTRDVPTIYETVTPIPAQPNFHLVKKGETLFSLAKKYEVSLKELKKWNNLTSNLIKPGQKLKLQP